MLFAAFVLILAALLYSVAERHTRDAFTVKRVGGLTFVRAGRLSFSYSVRRG